MYILYHLNDGLFCLNCLNGFFCIFILEIKDLKKKKKNPSSRYVFTKLCLFILPMTLLSG